MAPIEEETFIAVEDVWEDTVEEVNHMNNYSNLSLEQVAQDELGEDEMVILNIL